jgi:hypothetical protein
MPLFGSWDTQLFEIFYEICQTSMCYNWRFTTYADKGGLEESMWRKNNPRDMSCRIVQYYSECDMDWVVYAII